MLITTVLLGRNRLCTRLFRAIQPQTPIALAPELATTGEASFRWGAATGGAVVIFRIDLNNELADIDGAVGDADAWTFFDFSSLDSRANKKIQV